MADIKKKLKKLQGDWEESEAAEGGRKRFKDGDFTVKLKSMEIGESKASGRVQLVTTFEVVEPEKYEGEEIRMYNGIDDKGMPYLKLLCNQFGIEIPDAPGCCREACMASSRFLRASSVSPAT